MTMDELLTTMFAPTVESSSASSMRRSIERPLVKTDDSAVGFYALNGESLVTFKETEKKERICEVLERVGEQNPRHRILLVLDKHGSHCKHTRKRAHQLGIDLIFLPTSSPYLNPIEKVWDYLKWTMCTIIVEKKTSSKTSFRRRLNK